MTEQAMWDEQFAEELCLDFVEEVQPSTPELTIFSAPLGEWCRIPSIEYWDFHPTHAARKRDARTRQVGLLLAVNPSTGMMPVVLPEKASTNEWSLIQGGIGRRETASAAVQREARKEAGLSNLTRLQYVGSFKAPVDAASSKKLQYDYQLFHCFVAYTSNVMVQTNCEEVACASLFHRDTVLRTLLKTASPVKRQLLPLLFRAAVEHNVMPPCTCKRE